MKYQDVIEKIKEYIVEYEEKDFNFNYLSHSSKDIKEKQRRKLQHKPTS